MLHVVVVAVVEPVLQVAVLTVEGRRDFLELLVGHLRVQTVNLHLQTDKAVLGVVGVAHRLLDGLDAGTWRAEYDGIFAACASLRFRQVAIHGVAAVGLQLQQVAVELVGGVLVHLLAFHEELVAIHLLAGRLKVLFPERLEVGGVLRIGLQLFGREPYLHVVLVLLVAVDGRQPQVQESWLLHRTHVDGGPAVPQLHLAFRRGRHHVGPNLVADLHVLGNAVDVETYFHLRLLARLVEPVGMVGHRQPQIVRTIGIVLGPAQQCAAGHDGQ